MCSVFVVDGPISGLGSTLQCDLNVQCALNAVSECQGLLYLTDKACEKNCPLIKGDCVGRSSTSLSSRSFDEV